LQLMNTDLPLKKRIGALLRGLFPSRLKMARRYGFPPGSWQITVRYLPHLASRGRRYYGRFLRRLQGDPRLEVGARNTLALEEWLGVEDHPISHINPPPLWN
jgi:hypothetical protein